MQNLDEAIEQFNTRAKAGGWLQVCDPANAFVMPECEELAALWNTTRGSKDIPARDALTIRALKTYLPRLSMVERVQIDPPRFKFRIVGTATTQTLSERTGQSFNDSSATPEQTERWTQSALLSIFAKKPLRFPMVIRRRIVGEMIALPLADARGEVRYVLAYGHYDPARDWTAPVRDEYASARMAVSA